MNPRALIRHALADANGNELDAAAPLLLAREYAPRLREWALTFSHRWSTSFRKIRSLWG